MWHAIHHHYAQQRDELHELEMSKLRKRQANVGMQLDVVKAGTVSRRIPRAPKFTPVIRCFLKHPFIVEENDIEECYLFLTTSNPDRVRILVEQHRCFGCPQNSALVTHELNQCPHLRYCAVSKTADHHQVLCAPRKVYEEALPASRG